MDLFGQLLNSILYLLPVPTIINRLFFYHLKFNIWNFFNNLVTLMPLFVSLMYLNHISSAKRSKGQWNSKKLWNQFFVFFDYFAWMEFKGAGGSEVDFHFFVVSDRGKCQLSETFFEMKKYCSLPKLFHFEISKNTYHYIARVNFNRDFPKINFEIYLLLQFLFLI